MDIIALGSNAPRTFYRDSGAIPRFRGLPAAPGDGAAHAEDWIASTTSQFERSPVGLTVLPDGRYLRDAVREDPVAWLGSAHVERYGADPRLLVKLLDAGQRLPVHVHPDRDFAREHLDASAGKTEAWVVIEAVPDATVRLGFSRPVDADELARWRHEEDTESLLAATNTVPVAAGDALLVPAGTPHAIDAGVLLAELQEASDWSIFLETRDVDLGGGTGTLGLDVDVALACVDRGRTDDHRLAELAGGRGAVDFPEEADAFFRSERIAPRGSVTVDAGYGVLIVLAGEGEVTAEASTTSRPLTRGQTLLVPHEAGAVTLSGDDLVVLRARPPR